MATCPKDGTPIDVDYGMATCPSCGTILFIDMDGEAQIGTQAGISVLAPDAAGPGPEVQTVSTPRNDFDALTQPKDAVLSGEEISFHFPHGASPEAHEQVQPTSQDGQQDGASAALDMDDFINPQPSPLSSPVQEGPGAYVDPDDPLGFGPYANSEYSQAKDGPFLFRLMISSIDSKEIRDSLREALTDRRFAWDVDEIMRQISRGELIMSNVSPVKATIVINRIKRLPVRVRWEQYAVTQSDPPS